MPRTITLPVDPTQEVTGHSYQDLRDAFRATITKEEWTQTHYTLVHTYGAGHRSLSDLLILMVNTTPVLRRSLWAEVVRIAEELDVELVYPTVAPPLGGLAQAVTDALGTYGGGR